MVQQIKIAKGNTLKHGPPNIVSSLGDSLHVRCYERAHQNDITHDSHRPSIVQLLSLITQTYCVCVLFIFDLAESERGLLQLRDDVRKGLSHVRF